MSKSPSLKTEFFWLLLSNLFYAGCQYLMLIGIIKLTAPATVGIFAFALAVNAPIALFFSFSLRAVLISDPAERFSSVNYLHFRIATAAATFLSGVFFVLVTAAKGSLAHVIILIALIKAIESISDLIYGFLQKSAETAQIAKSMIIRGIFSAALSLIFLYWSREIEWLCFGWLVATVGTCVFYDWYLFRRYALAARAIESVDLKPNPFDLSRYKALVFLALPLGLAAIFSSLEVNVPRYFIEGSLGMKSLGLFSALAYPLILVNQVMGSLAIAPSPRLARMIEKREFKLFRRLLQRLVAIAVAVSFGSSAIAITFGELILSKLNGPAYALEYRTFAVLSLATGAASIAIFFGAALSAMQAFKTKLILQFISLAAVVMACAVAARHNNLYSMGVALFIGSVVSLISQVIACELHLRQCSTVAAASE